MQKYLFPKQDQWESILERPTASYTDLEPLVADVFNTVLADGDAALRRYTQQFDGVDLDGLKVDSDALQEAASEVDPALKKAIQQAKSNIETFHRAQQTQTVFVETQKGVQCWQEKRPIEKVGLYIPGGSAPLFSTLLMLAIPAQIAGCKDIILCTPPDDSGEVASAILYTAQLCGLTEIYKVGGIQAIAALTLGTESIPQVYKIFGPGNQYVTTAKQWSTRYKVAIDMPAGPSELLVVADHTADPDFVASDLLSQAEHGPDSQVILVTTQVDFMNQVEQAVTQQLQALPRKSIAEQALKHSKLICVDSDATAVTLINQYGPEHYIICMEKEDFYVSNTQNAGSVFIGNYTPESAGDYASGTNHTLPTNGYAKQYSGVNLDSYLKAITFQKITQEGIQSLGPAIELMAEAEGLQAHKNAVSIRLKRK